jgi:hypothetical protein
MCAAVPVSLQARLRKDLTADGAPQPGIVIRNEASIQRQ